MQEHKGIKYGVEPSYFTRFPGTMHAQKEFGGWQGVVYPRDSSRCPISVGAAQATRDKALEMAREYVEKNGDDF
ncbi:hypothetical protein [Coleofasciculus sp. FACHB-T130]|uniref:hypothetical protein n=1 Tax=Cyanophyceae TaxID=3028117 RepID=UPI00168696D3|nr:hypothetical protein [Coleofasciculus sp. FACHB-T130]MBD1878373.1 hypothetical protein [Coleofasciculus sp. FACHB-T130]